MCPQKTSNPSTSINVIAIVLLFSACTEDNPANPAFNPSDVEGTIVFSKLAEPLNWQSWGYHEIYILENGTESQLTSGIVHYTQYGEFRFNHNTNPRWSKQGDKIVFVSGNLFGRGNLFMMDLRSRELNMYLQDYCERDCEYPDFSASGDKIVFGRSCDIYVATLDGTRIDKIAENGFKPLWSPTSDLIVFTSWNCYTGKGFDIYLVNDDGTELTNITSTSAHEKALCWSPDGQYIAFQRGNGLYSDDGLYILSVDSREEVFITAQTTNATTWLREKDQVLGSEYSGGKSHLYTINIDGSGYRKIIADGFDPDCY